MHLVEAGDETGRERVDAGVAAPSDLDEIVVCHPAEHDERARAHDENFGTRRATIERGEHVPSPRLEPRRERRAVVLLFGGPEAGDGVTEEARQLALTFLEHHQLLLSARSTE